MIVIFPATVACGCLWESYLEKREERAGVLLGVTGSGRAVAVWLFDIRSVGRAEKRAVVQSQ